MSEEVIASPSDQRRRAAFRIAADGDAASIAAASALRASLLAREWARWRAAVGIEFATEPDAGAYARCLPGVALRACANGWRAGEGGGEDPGAEVIALLPARTFLVGDIEGAFDRIADTQAVAGVMAPRPPRPEAFGELEARDPGLRLARHFLFADSDPEEPLAARTGPFLPRGGVLFVPGAAHAKLLAECARLLPLVSEAFPDDWRDAAAWALAIAASGCGQWALPESFHWMPRAHPGDEPPLGVLLVDYSALPAESPYSDPFADAARYSAFLAAPDAIDDGGFRRVARALFGAAYPFAAECRRDVVEDPAEAYARAVAAQAEAAARWLADLPAPRGDPAVLAIARSGLFDSTYYLDENPDVAAAGIDPLLHYAEHGEAQGRWPNAFFNPVRYRERHGSAHAFPFGELAHYAEHGERAGLDTQVFSPVRYLRCNPALRDAIDRPLFHWLQVGRARALPGVMDGPLRRHLWHFERTKRTSPFALMRLKQGLVAQFGREDGFAHLCEAFGLPEMQGLARRLRVGQIDHARRHGEVRMLEAGGMDYLAPPLPFVGRETLPPVRATARSLYLACVADASVRGHSTLVLAGGEALYDAEGEEPRRFHAEFEFDNAVFQDDGDALWTIESGIDAVPWLEIDEAFSLLSTRSHAFGHWIWENLLKFVIALRAGVAPMPVLIDAGMNVAHRRSLEWLLPAGFTIIEVPNYRTVRARRLWIAPTAHFAAVFEKRDRRFRWDSLLMSGERAGTLLADLNRRVDAAIGAHGGNAGQVYLARRAGPHAHHVLENRGQVEALAAARGFVVVHPEDLDIEAQVRLVRGATHVLAPEGSAAFLMCFARPGTRLCVLHDPRSAGTELYGTLFGGAGIEAIMFVGPIVREHPLYYEWCDFEIDVPALSAFLDGWLAPTASG